MALKLVALDIDGTIVPKGADGSILPSERMSRAIRTLDEAGIAVVLASGRMFPGTRRVARHLQLAAPVICQQGCSVHDVRGTALHLFPIDPAAALDIVEFARSADRPYEWFDPVRYVASRKTPQSEEYGRLSGITPEYAERPELLGIEPTGVGVISSHREARDVHRALAARHGDDLHILDFPDVTVAASAEANKGHALSLVCEDLGIERQDVVAVGDSVNDAPMLAWAGRGFALSHSDHYAIDAADEVLDPVDDAVETFLEGIAKGAPRP